MSGVILLSVLFCILIMLVILTYYLRNMTIQRMADEELDDNISPLSRINIVTTQTFVTTAIILTTIGMLVSLYVMLRGTVWEGHFMEWLNIIVRLMHITFGIAWIGASFYFVFLENALNRTKNVREELAGNLWAIHGGGFYYLEKYKVAPRTIPNTCIGLSMKPTLHGSQDFVCCSWCITLMQLPFLLTKIF